MNIFMVFIFTWVGKVTLACDISDLYPLSSKVKHVGSLSQPPASHFFSLKTSPSAMKKSSSRLHEIKRTIQMSEF